VNWSHGKKILRGVTPTIFLLGMIAIPIAAIKSKDYFGFVFLTVTVLAILRDFILGFLDSAGLLSETAPIPRWLIERPLEGIRIVWLVLALYAALSTTLEAAKPTSAQKEVAGKYGLPVELLLFDSCEKKRICERYKNIRLSCAKAGNISKCVEIKMEGKTYEDCSDTGTSSLAEEVRPSFLQCLRHNEYLLALKSKK
jgi:hypothetical protein